MFKILIKKIFLVLLVGILFFGNFQEVSAEYTDIKPTFAYNGGNMIPYKAKLGENVKIDVIIDYNASKYYSFFIGFYVDGILKEERLINMTSLREIYTFEYTPDSIGVDAIKIVVDNKKELEESFQGSERESNNTIEKNINIYGEPSTFKVIDVTVDIGYYILDTSEQTIFFTVKSKKDYDDGIINSRLNIYYLIDERYKKGENFKTMEYGKSSSGSMIPVNTTYFGRQTTYIDEAGKNATFRTNLPNTKYHYIITDKSYDEIAINDKNKILYEGNFTTMDLIDQNRGSDFEIIPNSFNINYLDGDEYKKSRELYYAKVEFEYYQDLALDLDSGKKVRHSIKNNTTNKTMSGEVFGYGLTRVKSKTGMYLTKNEFGNFFKNGENDLEGTLDALNAISETNENNNTITQTLTLNNVDEVSDDVINVDGTVKSPGIRVVDSSGNTIDNTNNNNQISQIKAKANLLHQNKMDDILVELKQLRDIVKEQANKIKYLVSLKKDMKELSETVESAINNFITYGVDDNTKRLGAGERAAVMHSFKSAFKKLPETEDELADAIKIANGRWPSARSENAEKAAKKRFEKIYKKIANMDNPNDNAAITVMAYGLRQKAENRNLDSERTGIKTFEHIFGYHPSSTEDWNIMQSITYSGASRGADSDGDLLLDEREIELGTDPNNPDTDGDGFLDGEEVANGFDPLKK